LLALLQGLGMQQGVLMLVLHLWLPWNQLWLLPDWAWCEAACCRGCLQPLATSTLNHKPVFIKTPWQ
jgi:hypothetical protein